MGKNELTRIRFAVDGLRHVVCNWIYSQGSIFMNEKIKPKEKPKQTKKLVMIGICRKGTRKFTIKVAG